MTAILNSAATRAPTSLPSTPSEEASVKAVLTPSRPRSIRPVNVAVVLIGFVVEIAVAFAVIRMTVNEPTTLRRLTVQNPTPYLINVEVSGAERDGWLDVGSFRRERTRTVEELADQGDQWVFRFSYGGAEAGEVTVSGDQLARDGWSMTVPSAVGENLRQGGLSESAR